MVAKTDLQKADSVLRTFFAEFYSKYLKEAGAISLVKGSSSDNPVTQFDLLLSAEIEFKLDELGLGPTFSEEKIMKKTDTRQTKNFWLVDPIDGTKEFMQRIPECASSIALIDPITNKILYSCLFDLMRGQFYSSLDQPMTPVSMKDRPDLLFSRSETKLGLDQYLKSFSDRYGAIRPVGSIAFKMLSVYLAPQDIITVSLQPKHLWDIAGGVGLLQSLPTMKISDLSGHVIDFGRPLHEKINGIIVAPEEMYSSIFDRLMAAGAGQIPDHRAPAPANL